MLQLACWSAETGQAAKGDIIGAQLMWGASLCWLGSQCCRSFVYDLMLRQMYAGCWGLHRASKAESSTPSHAGYKCITKHALDRELHQWDEWNQQPARQQPTWQHLVHA